MDWRLVGAGESELLRKWICKGVHLARRRYRCGGSRDQTSGQVKQILHLLFLLLENVRQVSVNPKKPGANIDEFR